MKSMEDHHTQPADTIHARPSTLGPSDTACLQRLATSLLVIACQILAICRNENKQ